MKKFECICENNIIQENVFSKDVSIKKLDRSGAVLEVSFSKETINYIQKLVNKNYSNYVTSKTLTSPGIITIESVKKMSYDIYKKDTILKEIITYRELSVLIYNLIPASNF